MLPDLVLHVCMSDHNSGTPSSLCLLFLLENSVEPRKYSQLRFDKLKVYFYRERLVSKLSSQDSLNIVFLVQNF